LAHWRGATRNCRQRGWLFRDGNGREKEDRQPWPAHLEGGKANLRRKWVVLAMYGVAVLEAILYRAGHDRDQMRPNQMHSMLANPWKLTNWRWRQRGEVARSRGPLR